MKVEKQTVILWIKRFIAYLVGMFLIAFGVNIAIKSQLGVSPVNAIPLVLSLQLPALSMGTWVWIVFSVFVLVQLVLLRKDFKWYFVFQFAVSAVFGWLVDMSELLCNLIVPSVDNYLLRILYAVISTVFIAVGILLYLEPNIMSMPGEGVTVAMTKVLGRPLSTCKLIFDVTIVAIAAVLSLIFFKQLAGVREGTVIIAIGVGLVMKPIAKVLKKPLHTLIFGKDSDKEE